MANKAGDAAQRIADNIPWNVYIIDEALSSSKIARLVGKGEKWVRTYVPEEFRQQLVDNGLANRRNISRTKTYKGAAGEIYRQK